MTRGGQYEPPVLLSSKAVGDIVTIKENNTPVDYIIVQQGAPSGYNSSCNGAWLLRKDCESNRPVTTSSTVLYYAESALNNYLNNNFINKIESNIRNKIRTVKIPVFTARSGVVNDGLECKCFILSYNEINLTSPSYSLGTVLNYFENTNSGQQNDSERIANYNNSPFMWSTRSGNSSDINVYCVNAFGGFASTYTNSSSGVRPCFVLPSDQIGVNNDGSLYVIS